MSVYRRPGGCDTVCWRFAGRTHTLIRTTEDAFILHCLTWFTVSSFSVTDLVSRRLCAECTSSCCTRQQQRRWRQQQQQHVALFPWWQWWLSFFPSFVLFFPFLPIIKLHRQNFNFLSFAFWWLKVKYVELMWRQGGFFGNIKSNRWIYVQEKWYCTVFIQTLLWLPTSRSDRICSICCHPDKLLPQFLATAVRCRLHRENSRWYDLWRSDLLRIKAFKLAFASIFAVVLVFDPCCMTRGIK